MKWNERLKGEYVWTLVFMAYFGMAVGMGMTNADRWGWYALVCVLIGFLCCFLSFWKAPPEMFEEMRK